MVPVEVRNVICTPEARIGHAQGHITDCVYMTVLDSETKCETVAVVRGSEWTIISNPHLHGRSALHVAARLSGSVVTQLANFGCDVNNTDAIHGNTPLHYACAAFCNETITALVQHGACLNSVNLKMETPLVKMILQFLYAKDSQSSIRLNTMKDLVSVGFGLGEVQSLPQCIRRKAMNVYRQLKQHKHGWVTGVQSLQSLCRLRVTKTVGGVGYRSKVEALKVPMSIKGFLCYDEFTLT